ncbi:MAG: HAMP domain-containing sensor histidine kinase, partial [Pseudomonadota bacterium]
PELAKILRGLNRADTRIWVIDSDRRVRTVVGNIILDDELNQLVMPSSSDPIDEYLLGYLRYYYNRFLQFVFSFITESSVSGLNSADDSIESRNDMIIDQALTGVISSDRRPGVDGLGTIIMSAHPIFLGGSIPGAVVVEQSTNQVLRRQQETLENVISVTLLVLMTVVISLLIFASRLTLRIRRLRDATDRAIDRDGRVLNQRLPKEERSLDEIGDLSRSVSSMLARLSQYTTYLKGLPDTLAHEVSNPLNVVNSSLHNLSRENESASHSKYMERAKNGLYRIGAILQNLTEAANLEQALQSEDRETIDLVELLESCVESYSDSNPEQKFKLSAIHKPLIVDVAPDFIAQALDKLIDNAIDFAAPGTPIVVTAKRDMGYAKLEVSNEGSNLPKDMAERIFEPLVSLGRKDAQKSRLGMGLYVVKLITSFHGGDVYARNMQTRDGVTITISLPIHDLFAPVKPHN